MGVDEGDGVRTGSHTEKGFVCQSNQFGLYFASIEYLEMVLFLFLFFCIREIISQIVAKAGNLELMGMYRMSQDYLSSKENICIKIMRYLK